MESEVNRVGVVPGALLRGDSGGGRSGHIVEVFVSKAMLGLNRPRVFLTGGLSVPDWGMHCHERGYYSFAVFIYISF